MAETLGSLIDKLTIVDLKLWHCQEALYRSPEARSEDDAQQLQTKNDSLLGQRERLIQEIDAWVQKALHHPEDVVLMNPQNKMYGRYRKD